MKIKCLIKNKEFEGHGTPHGDWVNVKKYADGGAIGKPLETFVFHKDNKTVITLDKTLEPPKAKK